MTSVAPDRFAAARSVADAVLYEGYVLYPYRASSRKNQARWQFGVLTPRSFAEADGSERWSMRTECLVDPDQDPGLIVRIRCLQVQHRAVEAATESGSDGGPDPGFVPVEILEVDGKMYVEWDEAVDQVVELDPLCLSPLEARSDPVTSCKAFEFAGGTESEAIVTPDGAVAGRVVRRRHPVQGHIQVEASRADQEGSLIKVAVTVDNATGWDGSSTRRDDVMGHALVAVHTMLAVEGGAFVSLLDPPDEARGAVAGCRSTGTFPVLIGEDDVMLSSPIILYDHPEIAPESPGDLYDSTEIDEILALRVLTLTDDEKAEARGTDPRSAAIIDRCDDMPPEMWDRLHGAIRAVGAQRTEPEPDADPTPAEDDTEVLPWWDPAVDAAVDPWTDSVRIGDVDVTKGSAVRLRPSRRSDAQDIFVNGLTATVAGIFTDVDGCEQVAVTIDDDPATEELAWQGRYLFFFPDEVEPLPYSEGAR